MKQISHYNKVMWGLYCEYSYIPSDVVYIKRYRYEWSDELDMRMVKSSFLERQTKRSAAEWSFIHSKYHYVTKVDPIYYGSLTDFINYLDYRTWGGRHRTSPYAEKKSVYGSCDGQRKYFKDGQRDHHTKWQKKPPHVKKKTLSEDEIRRREWRNKIKDPRDQGSRFNVESGWTELQRTSNKAERRKINTKIKKNKWETYPKSSMYWELRDCQAECCEHKPQSWEYNYPENDWDNWSHPRRRESLNPWDYY